MLAIITVEIFNVYPDVQKLVPGLDSHTGSFAAWMSQYWVKPLEQGYHHFFILCYFPLCQVFFIRKGMTYNCADLNNFIEVSFGVLSSCCSKLCTYVLICSRSIGLFSATSDKGKLRNFLNKSGSLLMSSPLVVEWNRTTGAFSLTGIGDTSLCGSHKKVTAMQFFLPWW